MADPHARTVAYYSPGRLAMLVPCLMVLFSLLTLANRAYYDEAREDAATQTAHLQYDQPRLALTELWIVPFEGLGQLSLMTGQRMLLWLDDSAAAQKLAAIATQVVVYLLWLGWAGRFLSPLALTLGSLLFVFPPDNYFGAMIMSHGHHSESLIFLLAAFILLQRAPRARWLAGTLGALAGFAIAFYPSNIILAGFALLAIGRVRTNGLPLRRRWLWFGTGMMLGYLPLVVLLTGAGLPWHSQITATDDPGYRFCQGLPPVRNPDPILQPPTMETIGLRLPQIATKTWRTMIAIYIVGGGPSSEQIPSHDWYIWLGAFGSLVALGWWLWRGGSPRYVREYCVVLAAAYLFGGDRFTVSLDHPGEPDAFRYLIGLYPILFTAWGSFSSRLLQRWNKFPRVGRQWPGILAAVFLLLFFAFPALTRCHYHGQSFAQAFALRFASPSPLGLHYYRHYGLPGLGAALKQAEGLSGRWPGIGPLASELTARGLAVAAMVDAPAVAGAMSPPEGIARPVFAGWWQGRGYAAAGMAATDTAGRQVIAAGAPAELSAAGWYWYGVGLWRSHRPADSDLAAQCPLPLRAWYWRGYGEGILNGIVTVNNDFSGGRERSSEVPPDYQPAARAGFLRGALVLVHPDRYWTRVWFRSQGLDSAVVCALVPALVSGDFPVAEELLW